MPSFYLRSSSNLLSVSRPVLKQTLLTAWFYRTCIQSFPPPLQTVTAHISSCKCQCPHTSASFFLNIKQNNDDVLVCVFLSRELGKMAISFIMSHVCFCCGAVVKIVSASRGCIKKTHYSGVSTGLIYFPSRVKCHKRQPQKNRFSLCNVVGFVIYIRPDSRHQTVRES